MASISFRDVVKIYDGADKPVVPKLNLEYESAEGVIKLYNNQVFIADNIKISPWCSRTTPCIRI